MPELAAFMISQSSYKALVNSSIESGASVNLVYASRSGTSIEIISKVVLRHSNLSTTQRYLGKVSETEAMRWIENLYG